MIPLLQLALDTLSMEEAFAALQGGVDAAQISEHLASQSRDMGDPGFDDRYGWGYLPTP